MSAPAARRTSIVPGTLAVRGVPGPEGPGDPHAPAPGPTIAPSCDGGARWTDLAASRIRARARTGRGSRRERGDPRPTASRDRRILRARPLRPLPSGPHTCASFHPGVAPVCSEVLVLVDNALAVIVGTRPEAVKVAPVVSRLRALGQPVVVIDTGQQPGRVDEALAPFDLSADVDLGVERADGGLAELVSEVVVRTSEWLQTERPRAVTVQGDTTSAFAAALVAAMDRVPTIHLEAGLRTGDRSLPFPEEINRALIADVATLHLAPTPAARDALATEGMSGDRVVVTGNTVVDALETLLAAARTRALFPALEDVMRAQHRLVVTVHRREAWGEGVRAVSSAVANLLAQHDHLAAAVVTHPNPAVAADVRAVLDGAPRCAVVDPLPYDDMLALLTRASVVLTDSGGIQEEAPSIGVPCVVARSVTERSEGVRAGWADLVGLSPEQIVDAVSRRLRDPGVGDATPNPYGDGRAAERAAAAIRWHLGEGARPLDWEPVQPSPSIPSV